MKPPCKIEKNFSKFIDLNNPEICYFWGYFWADGYIAKLQSQKPHRISLKIAYQDFLSFPIKRVISCFFSSVMAIFSDLTLKETSSVAFKYLMAASA